jgi:hypothetical protein
MSRDGAFVEYLDHASRQRQAEEDLHAERGGKPRAVNPPISNKTMVVESKLSAEEQERMNARRALRSASVRVFVPELSHETQIRLFLVGRRLLPHHNRHSRTYVRSLTIRSHRKLMPASAFNAPYALSTVGYVPGVILYFFVRQGCLRHVLFLTRR